MATAKELAAARDVELQALAELHRSGALMFQDAMGQLTQLANTIAQLARPPALDEPAGVRAEMFRDDEWIPARACRLEISIDKQPELRGAHGGPIAAPWRVVDGDGRLLATDPGDTERRLEGGAPAVETDESPTTEKDNTREARTT